MTVHEVRMELMHKDRPSSIRVLVGGTNYAGHGIGIVRRGESARQVCQGPLVDGPWAYAYGLATVLAGRNGTGDQIDRESTSPTHQVIRAKIGDVLRFGDQGSYRIEPDHNSNIKLVPVDA